LLPLHRLLRLGLLALAGVLPAGGAHAQDAGTQPQAAKGAAPVWMKAEPGNSTASKPGAAPGGSKPKLIQVPGKAPARDASAAPPAPSNDYEFCNRTSYVLSVAVGIKNGAITTTRGWWPLNPGDCRVFIKGPLTSSEYFSHAKTSFVHMGSIRAWAGKHKLCAGKGTFQATTSDNLPCGPGYSHLDFALVNTGGKPGWRTTLAESEQIKTLEQARVAGLQRLLSDVGLFEGAIDGVGGPKLNEAFTRARNVLGVSSGDQSVLQARLVAEANRIQQSSGLTLCNRSSEVLFTAYGREINGKKESSGWYVLLPGECEKVVKDPLNEQHVYGFATVDKPQPDAPVGANWRGAHLFCTKDGEFDFEDSANCETNGFVLTGFSQADTEGRPGHVIEFGGPDAPTPEN
jgi:uncharacterized membrane protein